MEKNIEPNFRTDKNLMETLYSEGQYLGVVFWDEKKIHPYVFWYFGVGYFSILGIGGNVTPDFEELWFTYLWCSNPWILSNPYMDENEFLLSIGTIYKLKWKSLCGTRGNGRYNQDSYTYTKISTRQKKMWIKQNN